MSIVCCVEDSHSIEHEDVGSYDVRADDAYERSAIGGTEIGALLSPGDATSQRTTFLVRKDVLKRGIDFLQALKLKWKSSILSMLII